MAGLNRRKKATAEVTAQDLLLALAKAVGTDHTQEYNPDEFSSMWVDLYSVGDEESYHEQGAYIHNLLQQLYVTLNTRDTTAIVPVERKTKVWFTQENRVRSATDADIVDTFLNNPTVVKVSSLINEDYTELELLVLEDIDV